MMQGAKTTSRPVPEDFVEFWDTGQTVKGEFHCTDCGYGVTIVRELPPCPMCGGKLWEQSAWSPFMRRTHQPL